MTTDPVGEVICKANDIQAVDDDDDDNGIVFEESQATEKPLVVADEHPDQKVVNYCCTCG